MSKAIETSGVCYRPARDFEIRDLSLSVPTGSVYGFLGPNGSGKTTTIRLIMGQHRAASGSIQVLDRRVPRDVHRALQRIGYVPERPHLYPSLTVAEAVRYHSAFYETWDDQWADTLFDRFALPPDRRISRLSKGELGKLMTLMALGQRPDLLILDEPTEGLDPVVRRELTAVILDYVATHGATVFISSHLVHELERFCDWVGIMDVGRLVAEMPMQEFKTGIKRLRIIDPPVSSRRAPFDILHREPANNGSGGETWLVRGWRGEMHEFFAESHATLREVVDLDLEEGFVELLRAYRAEMLKGA